MRLITHSLAATFLVAAGLALATAQAPPAPPAGSPPPPRSADATKAATADPFAAPPSATEKKPESRPTKSADKPSADKPSAASTIAEKLDQSANIDIVEMPLKDVVTLISELHKIPVVLSTKKLEEVGVSTDTPITKSLHGIRLKSALNLILRDLELAYLVRDEVLQITTPEDAESNMEIRIYDCRDILAMPVVPGNDQFALSTSAAEARAEQLMTIITTNVDPHSWQGRLASDPNYNGPGSVSEYSGLIVVTQTAHTHEKIEHVLDMLRTAAGLDPPTTTKVVR